MIRYRLVGQFAACVLMLATLPAARATPISFEHSSFVGLGAPASSDPALEPFPHELTEVDPTGPGADADESGPSRDRSGASNHGRVRAPIFRGGTEYNDNSGIGERGAGTPDSSQLVREMLRSYVNVTAAAGRAPAATGRGPRRAGEDAIDVVALLGGEWVQDAMRGVVGTVLRRDTNEQGETTFSLLGFGNFSLFVSGDRSVVSLTQSDNVVARTDIRDVSTQGGDLRPVDSAMPGALPDADRSAALRGNETLLERLLDLLVELVTHPLTLLGLAIAVIYAVVIRSFAGRARRKGVRAEKKAKKKRRRRSQSDSPATQRS